MALILCGPSAVGKSNLLEHLKLDRRLHDFDVFCFERNLNRTPEAVAKWADSHNHLSPLVLSNDLVLVEEIIRSRHDFDGHTFVLIDKPTREIQANMISVNSDGHFHPVAGVSSKGIEDTVAVYRRLADFTISTTNDELESLSRSISNLSSQPYLTRAAFEDMSNALNAQTGSMTHWNSNRWHYHARSIELLAGISGQNFLEIGTMGIQLHGGSITMDFSLDGLWPTFRPDVSHDARVVPWPFADKSFDCVVALRVFHHLVPHQRQAFREARRVGKSILLVLPHEYHANRLNSAPVSLQEWTDWNDGVGPTWVENTGHGVLFFWADANHDAS